MEAVLNLKDDIARRIVPYILSDWELEEYTELLESLPAQFHEPVLAQIPVIWPVSHSLCYTFLEQSVAIMEKLDPEQLSDFVIKVLDVYEVDSLHAANLFMADIERTYIAKTNNYKNITFNEITGRLLPYVRGMANRKLELAIAAQTYTDTSTIYLPEEIHLFETKEENFLVYKLIVSFQWGFITGKTYILDTPENVLFLNAFCQKQHVVTTHGVGLNQFFHLFHKADLARELFHLFETMRIKKYLSTQLPGLMRDCQKILPGMLTLRSDPRSLTKPALIIELLKHWILSELEPANLSPDEGKLFNIATSHLKKVPTITDGNKYSLKMTALLYPLFESSEQIVFSEPLPFQGSLKPEEAEKARLKRRADTKNLAINALASILPASTAEDELSESIEEETRGQAALPDTNMANIMLPLAEDDDDGDIAQENLQQIDETLQYITLEDQHIEIPEQLKLLLEEIKDDMGLIPSQYISSALQMAGRGMSKGNPDDDSLQDLPVKGTIIYDEWDFRRSDYRKNWCVLHEKKIDAVKGTFVPDTLAKYRGLHLKLRKQFERLRTRQRFIKRQKDGDDIDFDALCESLSDMKAGLAPSDRLYIRQIRDERDISAVFLVDMSLSTEGWVSKAIKESLVLLCEALEVLGDNYAIYGFSGMRRLRSEIFQIKSFKEAYDDEVKGKIAAILPKEYTRMGPPIRHVTKLLTDVEAKVRLIITLSDGKPEDYDDYKGDYAIEDTRRALIEAKTKGIHPFCITIDRDAQDYIAHMYGEVNYIFINDVKMLPRRVPEIYRTLTT